MIDFHSHILQGIDDGSSSCQESVDMLRCEREQNIDKVIATSHWGGNMSISDFLTLRKKAYDELNNYIIESKEELPEIILGAEVRWFRGIEQEKDIEKLCIDGTKVILIELPYEQWDEEVYKSLIALIYQYELKIVLAHIERYYDLQKKKNIWKKIIALPVIFQFNAGGLANKKRHKGIKKIMKKGINSFVVGTDCHNMESRKPNIDEGIKMLNMEYGDWYCKQAFMLAEKLITRNE